MIEISFHGKYFTMTLYFTEILPLWKPHHTLAPSLGLQKFPNLEPATLMGFNQLFYWQPFCLLKILCWGSWWDPHRHSSSEEGNWTRLECKIIRAASQISFVVNLEKHKCFTHNYIISLEDNTDRRQLPRPSSDVAF